MAVKKRMKWDEVKSYGNAAESHGGPDWSSHGKVFGAEAVEVFKCKAEMISS